MGDSVNITRGRGLEKHWRRVYRGRVPTLSLSLADLRCTLPAPLATEVQEAATLWDRSRGTTRLWQRDATLWTGAGEDRWLGWLDIVAAQRTRLEHFAAVATLAHTCGCPQAVLLGMGGSSLCPEVLARTFGSQPEFPALQVLDSTDPAQVRAVESRTDPAHTLFIVASKSGTTLEPDILRAYFWERSGRQGSHFIAITDPGSKLETEARRDGYAAVYHGVPEIGGRFSALSDFGLVPAALLGLDVGRLVAEAERMVQACGGGAGVSENPGVALGVLLGTLARGEGGLNKLTLIVSPAVAALGAWLEQLVAESTGKRGKAIIPVDGERVGPPGVYGEDRLFVCLSLEASPEQDARVTALERAERAVVRIAVPSPYALGAEFFRWQIATAVAGSLLGVNPFDQPDVEASKVATRALTTAYEKTGELPQGKFSRIDDPDVADRLRALLGGARPGDYFALLAYVEMNARHEEQLQAIRHDVRDAIRKATCLGFGPRFLHSTGQAYKGGPNAGIFLQITADDAADVPIPGRRYTFGVVKAAQAAGDLQVLRERGRRVLRVHLGTDVAAGLERLREAMTIALRHRSS